MERSDMVWVEGHTDYTFIPSPITKWDLLGLCVRQRNVSMYLYNATPTELQIKSNDGVTKLTPGPCTLIWFKCQNGTVPGQQN